MPEQNTGPSARITASRSAWPGGLRNACSSASSISRLSALRLSARVSTTVRTGPDCSILMVAMGSGRVAVDQFDGHALRATQEGDAHAGPHGGRLHGEFRALGLEL